MRLKRYTDHSLRVLIYLGMKHDAQATIAEVAGSYGISRNHLVKVGHNLATPGYIQTYMGKSGDTEFARPAGLINLGEVVRHTETSLEIIDCWKPLCPLAGSCILKSVATEACDAFLAGLDRYTIADLVKNRDQLLKLLEQTPITLVHTLRR